MLLNRQVILAKIESTYDTDPILSAATDAVEVENLAFSFEGARMHERQTVKESLSSRAQSYGGTLGTLSFDVYLRGSGTAGTPPDFDALLQACGMNPTNVPATSDTYAPISTAIKSVWIDWFEDGLQHSLGGCRGTMSASLEGGVRGKLSFTMTGHHTKPTDVALPTPTYDSTIPPTVINLSSFAVDSYAANVAALSFDLGITLAMPTDITAVDGFGEVEITGRKLTGSIDPLAKLIATYDWVTKWQSEASVALDTGVVGSVAGNRWQLQFPTAQYVEVGHGDRDGIITRQIAFAANENTGDDEMSLAFT